MAKKEIQAYYKTKSLALLKYNFLWFVSYVFVRTKLGRKAQINREMASRALMAKCDDTARTYAIDEIKIDDSTSVYKYLKARTPFVIRGFLNQDICASGLTFDHLAKEFGDQSQAVFPNDKRDVSPVFMKVKDIVKRIKNGDLNSNVLFGNLIYNNQDLREKFKNFSFKSRLFYRCSFLKVDHLFLSAAGTSTKCHSEFGDNLFLQVKGQKKWMIYRPMSSYAFKPLNLYRLYLYADPRRDQVLPGSDLLKVPHYEVTLNEGDLLYNPAFHWHYVETLKHSISVSMRFSRLTTLLKHPLLSFFILTSQNPNVLKQFLFRSNTNPTKL